jgi:hypothetical protein
MKCACGSPLRLLRNRMTTLCFHKHTRGDDRSRCNRVARGAFRGPHATARGQSGIPAAAMSTVHANRFRGSGEHCPGPMANGQTSVTTVPEEKGNWGSARRFPLTKGQFATSSRGNPRSVAMGSMHSTGVEEFYRRPDRPRAHGAALQAAGGAGPSRSAPSTDDSARTSAAVHRPAGSGQHGMRVGVRATALTESDRHDHGRPVVGPVLDHVTGVQDVPPASAGPVDGRPSDPLEEARLPAQPPCAYRRSLAERRLT